MVDSDEINEKCAFKLHFRLINFFLIKKDFRLALVKTIKPH